MQTVRQALLGEFQFYNQCIDVDAKVKLVQGNGRVGISAKPISIKAKSAKNREQLSESKSKPRSKT